MLNRNRHRPPNGLPRPARRLVRLATALVALLLLAGNGPPATDTGFGLRTGRGWLVVHDAQRAAELRLVPGVDDADVRWTAGPEGIEQAEITIGAQAGGWRGTAVLLRLDPRRLDFRLRHETRAGGTLGGWSADRLADGAVLGLNTGHFDGGLPWGWLVLDGIERRPPGHGPLSTGVVFGRDGQVRLVPWSRIPLERFGEDVLWAFQAYPTLLVEGAVPAALREPGAGVNLEHRDIRLALGALEDGRVIIVLTRFADAAGVSLPFGPTLPELAALLRALGARDAVALDGGLSAQLAVRETAGRRHWLSLRQVPLALEAFRRN